VSSGGRGRLTGRGGTGPSGPLPWRRLHSRGLGRPATFCRSDGPSGGHGKATGGLFIVQAFMRCPVGWPAPVRPPAAGRISPGLVPAAPLLRHHLPWGWCMSSTAGRTPFVAVGPRGRVRDPGALVITTAQGCKLLPGMTRPEPAVLLGDWRRHWRRRAGRPSPTPRGRTSGSSCRRTVGWSSPGWPMLRSPIGSSRPGGTPGRCTCAAAGTGVMESPPGRTPWPSTWPPAPGRSPEPGR
jgi:hypothetical protein